MLPYFCVCTVARTVAALPLVVALHECAGGVFMPLRHSNGNDTFPHVRIRIAACVVCVIDALTRIRSNAFPRSSLNPTGARVPALAATARSCLNSVERVPAFPHSPAPCAPAFTCANVHSPAHYASADVDVSTNLPFFTPLVPRMVLAMS